MNKFNELLACVQALKRNGETFASLNNQSRDVLKVRFDLLGESQVSDEDIDFVLKVFEILRNDSRET